MELNKRVLRAKMTKKKSTTTKKNLKRHESFESLVSTLGEFASAHATVLILWNLEEAR